MSTDEPAKQLKEKKRSEAEVQREAENERRFNELMNYRAMKEGFELLESEVDGLYDEMDKLAKKAPNEPITGLQLRILNSFIRKSKYLLKGDPIIDEVEVWVAAGDQPEYRDVVTVLRQIRQGLKRFEDNHYIFTEAFDDDLSEWEYDDEPSRNYFAEA